MAVQNPYNNYANNAIHTASRENLTLMLYEGALKFANQAIIALHEKDYEKMNELVKKILEIIRELQITLDRQYEISGSMYALYDYMYRRLVDANVRKDQVTLEEVRDLLREFRDMWKEAVTLAKSKKLSSK